MNSTIRILIVEDDPDDCLVFQHAIMALRPNFSVVFKDDAVQALRYLTVTEQLPALIISDINMPKMDGIKFRQSVLDHERTEVQSVPFIFFTTASPVYAKGQMGNIQANGIYEKPLSSSEVKQVLEQMFNNGGL